MGSIHITSFSPYISKKVKAVILMKEKSQFRDHRFVQKVLFEGEQVEITHTGIHIPFEYTVPKDAPYSIMQYPMGIDWGIHVKVEKSTLSSESRWHRFVVLPHVLQSESPPSIDKVPMQTGMGLPSIMGDFIWMWRVLCRSKTFTIHADEREYSPGDTVTGTLQVFKQFSNATLRIYFVLLKGALEKRRGKKKFRVASQEEHLALHRKDTFQQGSVIPFSFPLPPSTFPDCESENYGIHWKLRAVLNTRVAECNFMVRPLVY